MIQKAIMFTIDFRSHIPIYAQLVERIQHRIASGILKPGDQLPTVRQLAADLGINFNTVARAYRLIDKAGLISTQQGRGTYVLEKLPRHRARKLRREALEALTGKFLSEAAQLGFSVDEIERIYQEMLHSREENKLVEANR